MKFRYSIIGAEVKDVQAVGATNVKDSSRVGVIFADLEPGQAAVLESKGLVVEKVSTVTPSQVAPPVPVAAAALHTINDVLDIIRIDDVRNCAIPKLFGQSQVVAVIDTGIRETHEMLGGRVIHSKNFTSAPMRDDFDHGTGVASVLVAVAPLSGVINLKVLDENGEGTTEEVVDAVEECIMLKEAGSPIAPSVINISVGTEDSGPADVLRIASRAAMLHGILVVAAAGNSGPAGMTVISPASEEFVVAVGSTSVSPFAVNDYSSRGPTHEGIVKPDTVMAGQGIIVASSQNDSAKVGKSGTSFATPFVSGIALLLTDLGHRATGESSIDPRAFQGFLSTASVKPESAAAGKDNEYGYGMLYGPTVQDALGVEEAIDLNTVFMGVLSIGMLSIISKGMVSGNGK